MNLEQALKKYERLANLHPRSGETHLHLGLLHDAMGDYVQATKSYQRAVELSPKNAGCWFFDGTLLARFSNKTELAIRQWEKALELEPNVVLRISRYIPADIDYPLKERLASTVAVFDQEASQSPKNSYQAACAAFAKGLCLGVDQGMEAFEAAKKLVSTNARSLYLYALFLFVTEHWEKSVEALEQVIELDRNFTMALFLLARGYLRSDKISHALKILERLIKLDPRHPRASQTLAEVYFHQGKLNQAMETLSQALALDPENAQTHYLMARCHQQLYQLEAAVSSYREAARFDPFLQEAHFHLGIALSHLGKWQEAVKSLKDAQQLNPQDSYTHYHLGLAYGQLGQYEEAISSFTQTLTINPHDAFSHYNLGLAYEKMNQLENAIASYRQAIQISPSESYARYHLALCFQRLGQYSLALTELEEVLKNNPQDAYAAYNLGSVYAYLGMPDRALQAYSKASELNPNDLYAHFNIGAILAREGLIGEANEEFKKAMELTPSNDAELALYSTLASQMAVNIEIAKLNAKLKESYFETVKAIIGCLDAKDQYTAGHTNRVSVIATEIGRAMNLSKEEMDSLAIAAVLHDIGKLGVPDAILLKQGKLTQEEFLVMKEHPVKGAKILENVSFPWTKVVDYVKHHHERFDGTGYPDQLKGEEVPVGARILSLADFFDALATERPYKKAYPIPVVIEQAELQINKAFDPEIVEALKKVVQRLEGLYKPAEALKERPTWESSLVDSA